MYWNRLPTQIHTQSYGTSLTTPIYAAEPYRWPRSHDTTIPRPRYRRSARTAGLLARIACHGGLSRITVSLDCSVLCNINAVHLTFLNDIWPAPGYLTTQDQPSTGQNGLRSHRHWMQYRAKSRSRSINTTANNVQVTASEILPAGSQIGVKDGIIVCIGKDLPTSPDTKVIDCEGAYVTPGGVDSHVHLAQKNAPTGDGWETGSRSAIAGGTTTILAFASQQREDASLYPVLEDYHQKSRDQSYCDYGFHFILTNPTEQILKDELPKLAREEGITSVKLYMTYEAMKLGDRQILNILFACKGLGMTTMIHAESHDMIALIIEGLERNNHTEPYFHALARPRIAEDEASYRAISLAELADAPMLIVHMSSETAISHVRDAQTRLLPIHAETCPHCKYWRITLFKASYRAVV